MLWLSFRAAFASSLAYYVSRSIALSGLVLLATLFQPLVRYRLPMQRLAVFEVVWITAFVALSLWVIRYFELAAQRMSDLMSSAQLAALCIFASTLFVVVRGGTYIVRGVLQQSGVVPSKKRSNASSEQSPTSSQTPVPESEASGPPTSIAASVEPLAPPTDDVEEYNRGRLIGNLERIVLTIVVAAGSYAALAFLVAAKGVVRSDEFDNRDFAEYFLIGSLTSVLIALCAGIALRFALIHLWPDLLSLQIQ